MDSDAVMNEMVSRITRSIKTNIFEEVCSIAREHPEVGTRVDPMVAIGISLINVLALYIASISVTGGIDVNALAMGASEDLARVSRDMRRYVEEAVASGALGPAYAPRASSPKGVN